MFMIMMMMSTTTTATSGARGMAYIKPTARRKQTSTSRRSKILTVEKIPLENLKYLERRKAKIGREVPEIGALSGSGKRGKSPFVGLNSKEMHGASHILDLSMR